jgi:hypothetical protein
MTRRASLLLTFLAIALLAAACSVPRDNHARIVTNPQSNTSVPVTTSNVNAPRVQAKVYFVRSSDKKLEGVMTSVKDLDGNNVASPIELLGALIVDGPQENRLESKIPKTVTYQILPSPNPSGKELIVLLTNLEVRNVNRGTLILAFQQIVYTLTELPDVDSVQFSVRGALYPVPLKSGDKPVGQGVERGPPDYDPETIYTTTTTLAPTTAPAPTTPPPSSAPSTAPGASAPTSAPAATSR